MTIRILSAIALGGFLIPAVTEAAFVSINVSGQSNGAFWNIYVTSGVFPNDMYKSVSLASADGTYSSDDTTKSSQVFSSRADALASIPTSWICTVDAGLPTQKTYATTLTLGDLTSFTPIYCSYPGVYQADVPLNPTFTFTLPANPSLTSLYIQLQKHTQLSPTTWTYNTIETAGLWSSTTSWSPSASLLPSSDYYFEIYSGGTLAGFAFTPLQDADRNSPVGISTDARAESSYSTPFTTVPEPTFLLTTVAASSLLLRRQRVCC